MHDKAIKKDRDELLRLLDALCNEGRACTPELTDELWWLLRDALQAIIDDEGHVVDRPYWFRLRDSLKSVALSQKTRAGEDPFSTYAELYDEVIGRPCLRDFMAGYIDFVIQRYDLQMNGSKLLSIGCGTGLVEEYLLNTYPIRRDDLLGIDISPSMVEVASERINALCCDFLSYEPDSPYDIIFEGLNVFQYLGHKNFLPAVVKASGLTRTGGLFFGDFITPDHIRWYPNVIYSENVISLREPRLIEHKRHLYQESEIININRLKGVLQVTYEGRHRRYLPPLPKVRQYFKEAFGSEPEVFDPVGFEFLGPEDETTQSTRYVLVVRKQR